MIQEQYGTLGLDEPELDTIEEPEVPIAPPSVARSNYPTLDKVEANPSFKAMAPRERRQFLDRWINSAPVAQGLPPEERTRLLNRVQSRHLDDDTGTVLRIEPKDVKQFLGIPYKFGGCGPSGIDCSSLTQQIYQRNGVKGLPRTADEQWKSKQGQVVPSLDGIAPGDHLFFAGSRLGPGKASHTAYYAGEDVGPNGERIPMMYAASSSAGAVVKQRLDKFLANSGQSFLGAKRYPEFQGRNRVAATPAPSPQVPMQGSAVPPPRTAAGPSPAVPQFTPDEIAKYKYDYLGPNSKSDPAQLAAALADNMLKKRPQNIVDANKAALARMSPLGQKLILEHADRLVRMAHGEKFMEAPPKPPEQNAAEKTFGAINESTLSAASYPKAGILYPLQEALTDPTLPKDVAEQKRLAGMTFEQRRQELKYQPVRNLGRAEAEASQEVRERGQPLVQIGHKLAGMAQDPVTYAAMLLGPLSGIAKAASVAAKTPAAASALARTATALRVGNVIANTGFTTQQALELVHKTPEAWKDPLGFLFDAGMVALGGLGTAHAALAEPHAPAGAPKPIPDTIKRYGRSFDLRKDENGVAIRRETGEPIYDVVTGLKQPRTAPIQKVRGQNAVQEPSAAPILRSEQGQAPEAGGGRVGVGEGVQGPEVTGTGTQTQNPKSKIQEAPQGVDSGLRSAKDLVAVLSAHPNYTPEQAKARVAVVDAMLRRLANQTGRKVEDLYATVKWQNVDDVEKFIQQYRAEVTKPVKTPAERKAREDKITKLAEEAVGPEFKHDYSSTQINLPEDVSSKIKAEAANIPDADLAEDGRETQPHVTVKYGLHTNDVEAVRKVLANEPPIEVTLGKTSLFDAKETKSDYDVVKADVDSPDLHRLNKKIADAIEHTDTHPTYQPHATLAYVKAGRGKKYAGNDALVGTKVRIDKITFSDRNGNQIDVPLSGTKAPTRPTQPNARDTLDKFGAGIDALATDAADTEKFLAETKQKIAAKDAAMRGEGKLTAYPTPVSDKVYANRLNDKRDYEFTEVKATPVKIPEWQGPEFFGYKDDNGLWHVIEGRTGMSLHHGGAKTLKAATDLARKNIRTTLESTTKPHPEERLIAPTIDRYGMSPRYEGVEPTEQSTRTYKTDRGSSTITGAPEVHGMMEGTLGVKGEVPAAKGPYTLEEHKSVRKRIAEGDITADELKAQFERIMSSKDAILAELSAKTLKELAPNGTGGRKKSEIVKLVFNSMASRFALGEPVSYNPTGETYEAGLRRAVAKATDESIQALAKERKTSIEGYKKALDNPETHDDFRRFIDAKGEGALTPEQRVKWDELQAEQNRGQRERMNGPSETVRKVDIGEVAMTMKEGWHQKKGEPVFVVQMSDRVSPEQYKDLNAKAKQLGGYYSSFVKDQRGFQFSTKEAAEKFMALQEGDVSRADILAERQAEKQGNASDRLSETAEAMRERAEEKLNAERKTNTVKRAREAGYAEDSARADIAMADTLGNIADAIVNGDANHLKGVRARTHVEELETALRRAKQLADTAKKDTNEESRKRPITVEDIQHAELPYVFVRKSDVLKMAAALRGQKGSILLSQRLDKIAAALGEREDAKVRKPTETLREAANKLKDGEHKYMVQGILEDYQQIDRMKAMGIESLPELRAALREYLPLRGKRIEADPIKAAERELIGKKLPGFFPTPKDLAERMVDEADIKPGMAVLEPSGGSGRIADAIEANGTRSKVIEQSSMLADLLEKKGHDVERGDFLEHKGEYDRIVMNPPFENGQDIAHVQHAYDLLKPGGKVVAIMSEGPFFRGDRQATAFREWLERHDGTSEQLPDGTFKESNTGVNTRLVVIEKPSALLQRAEPTAEQRYQILDPDKRSVIVDDASQAQAEAARKRGYHVVPVVEEVPSKSGRPEGPGALMQREEKAPPFYSKAERVVEEKMGNRAPSEGVRAMLLKNGVKPDEMLWSGLDDLLKSKAAVTKEEVLQHLAENNVQVEEVKKGALSDTEALQKAKEQASIPWDQMTPEAQKSLLDIVKRQGYADTQFGGYQTPGGTNYRERFVTAPERNTTDPLDGWSISKDKNQSYGREVWWARKGGEEEHSIVTTPGTEERVARILLSRKVSPPEATGWRDGHDAYSDVKNPIVRLRTNDRVGPNGKKILFLEELQPPSKGEFAKMPDWAQKRWREIGMKQALRIAAEGGYDEVAWTTGEMQANRYDLSKQVSKINWYPSRNELEVYDLHGDIAHQGTYEPSKLPDVIGKDSAEHLLSSEPEPSGRQSIAGADLKFGGEGLKRVYDSDIPRVANELGKKFGARVGETKLSTGESVGWTIVHDAHGDGGPGYYARAPKGEQYVGPFDTRAEAEKAAVSSNPVPSIPITPELRKAAVGEGFPLFQSEKQSGAKGEPKAAYIPATDEHAQALIALGKKADVSSSGHEFEHHILALYERFAPESPEIQKDLDAMATWAGAKKAGDGKWTFSEKQREDLARAWERFEREGKTAVPELQGVFERLRDWMLQIYKKITGSSLDVNLDDSLRKTFDRMLGAEEGRIKETAETFTGAEPNVKETGKTETTKTAISEPEITAHEPEPPNPPGTTGGANIITEAERAARNLPPVEKQAYKLVKDAADRGRTVVEDGSIEPRLLAREIADNPRVVSVEEVNALVYDRMRLVNEHERTTTKIAQAIEDGDTRTQGIESARLHEIERDFDMNDQALQKAGREQSAAFAARKALIAKDYSYAGMLQRARAQKGSELTAAERARIDSLHAKIAELTEQVRAHEEHIADLMANRFVAVMEKEVLAEKKAAKSTRTGTRRASPALDDLASRLGSRRREVLKQEPETDTLYQYGEMEPEDERILQRMAKVLVEQGMTDADTIVKRVHEAAAPYLEDVTEAEIRDAISGYGKVAEGTHDPVELQLQQAKRAMRLISQIEAVSMREKPKASGFHPHPDAPEVVALRAELAEALKASGMREPWSMSVEQRQQAQATRLKARMIELERRINAQEFGAQAKRPGLPETPELVRLKAERDTLQARYDKLAGPTRLNERLVKTKERLAARVKAYEAAIEKREKLPDRKKPADLPYDTELQRIRMQQERYKAAYDEMILTLRRNRLQKIGATAVDVLNLPRAMMAGMFDVSMPGRQGWLLVLAHPKIGAKAIVKGYAAFKNPHVARKVDLRAYEGPMAHIYHDMELYLQPSELTAPMSAKAEDYQSGLAGKIPIVRSGIQRSSNAAAASMNTIRMDVFDKLWKLGDRLGEKDMDKYGKAIANGINKLTGRGSLGEKGNAASHLFNTILFSARFNASRVQVLVGEPMWTGTARSRTVLLGEYAKAAGAIGALLYLGHLAGGDVEGDLRHPESLKLRFGSKVIDIGAGLQQWLTFARRMYTNSTMTSGGKIITGEEIAKRGGSLREDLVKRFGRSKAAPVPGMTWDVVTGKDYIGNKVASPGEAFGNVTQGKLGWSDYLNSEPMRLFTPMNSADVAEAAEAEGVPTSVLVALLAFNGIGVGYYPKGGAKPKESKSTELGASLTK